MMTQVEVADIESQALGNRLREILQGKGVAYSLRAFHMRSGIYKDMLVRMMKGERYISPTDQEKIASALGITVERFSGVDLLKQQEEVSKLIKKQVNLKRALQLALQVAPHTLGCSERFVAYNNLGAAHYLLKQYEEAIAAYL